MAQQVRPVLADRAIRRSLVTTDGVHVHRVGTPSHKLRIPQLIPAVKNSTDYTSGSASHLHAGQAADRPQRSRKFGLNHHSNLEWALCACPPAIAARAAHSLRTAQPDGTRLRRTTHPP